MLSKVRTPTQSFHVGFRKELEVTFHGILFNLHVDFLDLPDENILMGSNGCHVETKMARPFSKK